MELQIVEISSFCTFVLNRTKKHLSNDCYNCLPKILISKRPFYIEILKKKKLLIRADKYVE